MRDISKLCTPPANKTDVINIAATTYDDKPKWHRVPAHVLFECGRLRVLEEGHRLPAPRRLLVPVPEFHEVHDRVGEPDALEALLKELDAELGPLPKKRGRDLPIPGGAQVAEDRGLDPPPSLEEQARMASALATPRLPGTTAGRPHASLPPQSSNGRRTAVGSSWFLPLHRAPLGDR